MNALKKGGIYAKLSYYSRNSLNNRGFTLGFSETIKDLKLTVESVFVGFVQSVTYFALAYLVDKADKNEAQRKADHEDLRKILLAGLPKKKCPFCDREYDLDRKVCPNCNK